MRLLPLILLIALVGCASRPPGADTRMITGHLENAATSNAEAQRAASNIGKQIVEARTLAQRIEAKATLLWNAE